VNITINALLPGATIISTLAAVAWAVITDRLVPAARLKDVREDGDKAVARLEAELARNREETNGWRDAYKFSEQARRVDAGHVAELLEGVRITSQVLTALPGASSEAPGETNASVAA
jgi:hypothetical protein